MSNLIFMEMMMSKSEVSAAKHTPWRALNDEQMRVLREAAKATDCKAGLRVSFWPQGRSLESRGLLEKRGRSVHRLYFITQAGRDVLSSYRDFEGRATSDVAAIAKATGSAK